MTGSFSEDALDATFMSEKDQAEREKRDLKAATEKILQEAERPQNSSSTSTPELAPAASGAGKSDGKSSKPKEKFPNLNADLPDMSCARPTPDPSPDTFKTQPFSSPRVELPVGATYPTRTQGAASSSLQLGPNSHSNELRVEKSDESDVFVSPRDGLSDGSPDFHPAIDPADALLAAQHGFTHAANFVVLDEIEEENTK